MKKLSLKQRRKMYYQLAMGYMKYENNFRTEGGDNALCFLIQNELKTMYHYLCSGFIDDENCLLEFNLFAEVDSDTYLYNIPCMRNWRIRSTAMLLCYEMTFKK